MIKFPIIFKISSGLTSMNKSFMAYGFKYAFNIGDI